MNGCATCGGFGNRHDPIAHGEEPQCEVREHVAYMDEMGNPDECTEDCPGCHWEGNRSCEALASGCDICDPDAVYAYAPENAEKLRRVREALDALSRETGAYEAGYKGWAQQVIRQVRDALGAPR